MKKKLAVLLAMLLLLCLTLTGCKSPSISESGLEPVELEEYEVLFGAKALGAVSDYCINESGIFYLKDGQMKYYEFASEQSYVLCGRANCRHKDESCPAYYDWEKINSVVGLAMVGDARYVVKRNEEANTCDLLQTDLYGEQQKVIYSLDIGDYQPGNWVVSEVSYVYYTRNMAWLTVRYQYVEEDGGSGFYNQNCVIGVRLSDGEELYRTALELNAGTYSLVLLSADYAVLEKTWDEVPQITEEEFYAAMEAGEYPEYSALDNPYGAYYEEWYSGERQPQYELILYDITSGQSTVVDSGPMRLFYYETGELQASITGRTYMGQSYDGRILYDEWGPDYDYESGSMDVYAWDPQTGTEESILHIEKGNILILNGLGGIYLRVAEEGRQFYYYTRTGSEGEIYKIYSYSLETGESEMLFETDEASALFNLQGETEEFLFGLFGDKGFCRIEKEEYEKGNFDAAEKLAL